MSNRVRAEFSMTKETMEAVAIILIGESIYHKGKKYKITKAELLEKNGIVDLIITFS